MSLFKFLMMTLMFLCPHLSFAKKESFQNTNQFKLSKEATIKIPKWRANASSLHYDFKGRHSAESGAYGFEKVSYSVQSLALTYLQSPTLSFSITGRFIKNYAETQFFGSLYKDQNEGFGDTKIKASQSFFTNTDFSLIDFGLSIPTGVIDKKNPNAPSFNYPYNMQLGSGTTDIELSLMRMRTLAKNQWGAFTMATWRLGRNSYDYRKGNEYIAKVWYTYLVSPYFNPGVWLNYWHVQRLTGADRTYGRNELVEFYHSSRHFWELTPNASGQIPLTQDLKLTTMIGRPLWQKSKNRDNVQVYAQWFAQIGIDGSF